MNDFFAMMKHDFKLVKLQDIDAKGHSDHIIALRELISSHDDKYPGIDLWFQKRVIPGLKDKDRVGFVGYYDEHPAASAIVKYSGNSKICHINVSKHLRGNHIGEFLFCLMVLEVRLFAKQMHLTMPEGLWVEKKGFFNAFGFDAPSLNHIQYRRGEDELRICSNYQDIWTSARARILRLNEFMSVNGYSFGDGVLMSIHPKYADKIMKGKKRVEIRRRFDQNWAGKPVRIYSSCPTQAVLGEALIDRVVQGTPSEIWLRFKDDMGCSENEYYEYVQGCASVYAIILSEVRSFIAPIPISQLSYLAEHSLKPPQSYYNLRNNKKWSEAISIAAFLQNSLNLSKPIVISL